MDLPQECSQNRDPLRLAREGTSQKERYAPALDPAYAPVDERTVAHRMVFAKAYAAFLTYFNAGNAASGSWRPFFDRDTSVLLATAAVQEVELYKRSVKEYFDFLNDRSHENDAAGLKNRLGYLFSAAATLASQLDLLKENLPAEIPLKGALENLIRSQLAPGFKNLLLYFRDGLDPAPPAPPAAPYQNDVAAPVKIMGEQVRFALVRTKGLSKDWIAEEGTGKWAQYVAHLNDKTRYPATKIHGSGATLFERVNHIATHNLFTSIFDTFLKAYARTVADAQLALEASFKDDGHEPHYALFLAFLRLFEYARDEVNTLTGRHLDFYYREVLRLREREAVPGKAHLLLELAQQAPSFLVEAGELFQAGKDDLGRDAFFASDADFPANQGKVAELKTVYRHRNGPDESLPFQDGRLFASPVANSDDGMGEELTTPDGSWHPFFDKIYRDGALAEIKMPRAEVGFALASHYLALSGGARVVTVSFTVQNPASLDLSGNRKDDVICLFSGEKGWFEAPATALVADGATLLVRIQLTGADPAVVPYSPDLHGYDFPTGLPMLIVKLRHRDGADYLFPALEDATVAKIDLKVEVQRLKLLAVSNDFGPADTSKPFQPFGALPVAGGSLVVGSPEAFSKGLSDARLNVLWQAAPAPFDKETLFVATDYLQEGSWQPSGLSSVNIVPADDFGDVGFPDLGEIGGLSLRSIRRRGRVGSYLQSFPIWPPERPTGAKPFLDRPDLSEPRQFDTASRQGFVRLRLTGDFGQGSFEQALVTYIKNVIDKVPDSRNPKPAPPAGPFVGEVTLDYSATQSVDPAIADASLPERSRFRLLQIAPFGYAVQAQGGDQPVYLLPQLRHKNRLDPGLPLDTPVRHEAEFYIGVADLKPPQNLALLFQVADGTADPLSEKPKPHLNWSYLRDNRWIPFEKLAVQDATAGLIESGIVTFSVPRDATSANTLLAPGLHWIRAAVASESDAVCRLRLVAGQALRATFADRGNDPAFPAKVLPPGTIAKLDNPDASVKSVTQPFPSFGGRGREEARSFYARVAERLRHKDRGIALWDCERLVLEAFPQIYQAKCLNHVQYEPTRGGSGIYREIAPGHVTVVTVPNQEFQNLRDPFRPYTSLGLLEEIRAFLSRRISCFAKLHVKNPQFEEVQAIFKVRLHAGLDESLHLALLNEAICRFLSPWAFPGGGSLTFGGRIYQSVLIDFVEEQPYVDYLTDFRLVHRFTDDDGAPQSAEKDEVEGSKAVSILVSARQHDIEAINPAEAATPGEICPCAA